MYLVMQSDGNLVLYRSDGRPLWASNTASKPVTHAVMQADGNLVCYDDAGHAHWASGTNGHSNCRLLLQDDGNLVIYAPAGTPLWASNTVIFGSAFVPGFKPSTRAPLFHNGPWPAGFEVKVKIGPLPEVDLNAVNFGLCGGMSFVTRDIFESGTPQLRTSDSKAVPIPVADHLLSRLIDSFSGVIPQWLHKTSELDHETWLRGEGLFAETVDDAHRVMATIDSGRLCPIGVVLEHSSLPWDVFNNHVELAYGYDLDDGLLTLHVYDCNRQGRDDIYIRLDISSRKPAKTIATNGTDVPDKPGTIRGFFPLPYTHADPSPVYVDAGVLTLLSPLPQTMTPGQTTPVTVSITNLGSTVLDPAAGYRIGTQSPQDNREWGTNRFPIPAALDPMRGTQATFQVTAPASAGAYTFQLQMVREGVHWFGGPTAPVRVSVGVTTPVCGPLQQQHAALEQQLKSLHDEQRQIDWSDPVAARHEAVLLNSRIKAVQLQIHNVEQQLIANGCPPS